MADEIEAPKVRVLLKWTLLRADSRQYRQQSNEMEPIGTLVVVEVPNEAKYVANNLELFTDDDPRQKDLAVLTPLGVKYVQDQVEQHYLEQEVSPDDFSDDEWEEESTKPAASDDEDDWGEETDSDPAEEKWSEEDEDWE